MTKSDFMTEAIRLSEEKMLAGEGGPFGAVIVKDGKIIARGWNMVTSTNDPTAHAEMVAIRNGCANLQSYDLSGCELFVNCEPCPMCLAAAYWAHLDSITYAVDRNDAAEAGFDDAFIYGEVNREKKNRHIKMHQYMRREALPVFSLWKNIEEKALY